jgi:hypothetical protein
MICALQEVLAFWLYSFSLLLLVMGLWLYFFHWYVWLFWLWPFYFFFPPPWFGSFDVKIWVSCKFLYPSLSLHVLNIWDLINLYWYLQRERYMQISQDSIVNHENSNPFFPHWIWHFMHFVLLIKTKISCYSIMNDIKLVSYIVCFSLF